MILPPIAWESLPDFTLADATSVSASIVPAVDQGYDIEGVRRTPARTEEILSACNGVLCTRQHRMRFFINSVEVATGISARFGQGRRTRDMYPQAFVMPLYKVNAQSLTQEDYGLMCEFVHAHHQEAVGNGNTVQLSVREGWNPYTNHENLEPQLESAGMAGYHKPIEAAGFVLEMPRTHERFVYTPEFEFEFSVMQSYIGVFSGQVFTYDNVQESIMEILEAQERPFSQAPQAKPAPKVITPEEETQLQKERHEKAFGPGPGINSGPLFTDQPPKPTR
jgi:hypothetical protein